MLPERKGDVLALLGVKGCHSGKLLERNAHGYERPERPWDLYD